MSETNLNLEANLQSLSPAPGIELFTLDTTPLTAVNGVTGNGYIYNWTPGTINDNAILFGGVTYVPLPIEFDQMKTTGQGVTPTPVIRISSLGGLLSTLISSFNDLVGAKVTRIRCFENNLDNGANPDPTAFIGPDVFSVDSKSHQDKNYVEFELAVSYDQQGRTFPARQVIADCCTQTYRYWNGSAFVQGTCPYTGSAYFDTSGNVTASPASDFCSKKLKTGCLLRYPNTAVPTWAFPGASATGIG
jgi:lambda family phage minor tail protein L